MFVHVGAAKNINIVVGKMNKDLGDALRRD